MGVMAVKALRKKQKETALDNCNFERERFVPRRQMAERKWRWSDEIQR